MAALGAFLHAERSAAAAAAKPLEPGGAPPSAMAAEVACTASRRTFCATFGLHEPTMVSSLSTL